MAGSGRRKDQQALKNQAMIVVRNITKQEVTNVIFPNGITVGADNQFFGNGFRVHGNAQISGVVNAQGFRVNGAPLDFDGSPFLSMDLSNPIITYGSDNLNEHGASEQSRGFTPEKVTVTVLQGGQTSTLSESEIIVQDATAATLTKQSFTQTEQSVGTSFSTFDIVPDIGLNAPVFPLTASIVKEGITQTKIIPKALMATDMAFNYHDLTLTSTEFGADFTPGSAAIQFVPPTSGPLRTGIFGNAYDVSGQTMSINLIKHIGLPSLKSDWTDAAAPGMLFYRSHPTTPLKVAHNLKGQAVVRVTGWDLSSAETLRLTVGVYKSNSSATTHTLVKSYDTLSFSGDDSQSLSFGTVAQDSIEPFVLGQGEGLSMQLLVSASAGFERNSTTTTEVEFTSALFLESGYE